MAIIIDFNKLRAKYYTNGEDEMDTYPKCTRPKKVVIKKVIQEAEKELLYDNDELINMIYLHKNE